MDKIAPMISKTRLAIVLVLFAAGNAQAQTYGQQPPLYPYAAQQSYAVEVAPNTYVIQRPGAQRDYPYITCVNCGRSPAYVVPPPAAPAYDRPPQRADRGLIEQLRQRSEAKEIKQTKQAEPAPAPVKRKVTTTTKVVREKPVVRETVRMVDDPPRVIERRHVVEDAPLPATRRSPQAAAKVEKNAAGGGDAAPRVIRAEAEVTILGPDRMSIRLFRRRGEPEAQALPGE
jgi:hypothetical protein